VQKEHWVGLFDMQIKGKEGGAVLNWLDRALSRGGTASPTAYKNGTEANTCPANGKEALDAFHFHLIYHCLN
jgi:hypothetical protein